VNDKDVAGQTLFSKHTLRFEAFGRPPKTLGKVRSYALFVLTRAHSGVPMTSRYNSDFRPTRISACISATRLIATRYSPRRHGHRRRTGGQGPNGEVRLHPKDLSECLECPRQTAGQRVPNESPRHIAWRKSARAHNSTESALSSQVPKAHGLNKECTPRLGCTGPTAKRKSATHTTGQRVPSTYSLIKECTPRLGCIGPTAGQGVPSSALLG
jgi:hypothetical protein